MTSPAMPLLGRVLGTEDATPTAFWFLVAAGQSVQLDDLVVARTRKPGGDEVAFRRGGHSGREGRAALQMPDHVARDCKSRAAEVMLS